MESIHKETIHTKETQMNIRLSTDKSLRAHCKKQAYSPSGIINPPPGVTHSCYIIPLSVSCIRIEPSVNMSDPGARRIHHYPTALPNLTHTNVILVITKNKKGSGSSYKSV